MLLLLLLVAGSPKRLLEMQQLDEKYAAKKLTNLHVMLERRSNLKPSMTQSVVFASYHQVNNLHLINLFRMGRECSSQLFYFKA